MFLTLLGFTTYSQAQDTAFTEPLRLPSGNGTLQVSATIDNDSIVVGEHSMVHLRVDGLGNTPLHFPTPDEMGQASIEVLNATFDTIRGKNQALSTIVQHLEIISFDEGKHLIEGLVVDAGNQQYAPDEELFITVGYAADADTNSCQAREDVAYIKEPYTFFEIARWPLLALLVAALVFAIVWIVRRHRQHQPIMPLTKSRHIPAHQRALGELEALRRKELWQKGRIKKYYTELTDIVRRFLRDMYGINASEMTSRQTLHAFHQSADWSEEGEQLLRQLLQSADMVKFAKREPASYEHDSAMQSAVDFVHAVTAQHALNNAAKEEDIK